jgi:hypothetical protein
VEKVIGEMLFDPDDLDHHETKERMLSTFKLQGDDGDGGGGEYKVSIKKPTLFNMVLGFVSAGATFRSASKFISVTQNVLHRRDLKGGSEGMCAEAIRVVCAASYQALSDILSSCWGYSIALDVGSSQGTSYLDIRLRLECGGLHNFHLISLPLFTNKTAGTQYKLLDDVLGVVDPRWKHKLISVATDGEPTMTGHLSGLQTRIEAAVLGASGQKIMRIWCGLHQLDLVVQEEYSRACDETFTGSLVALASHLRAQQLLINEMKTKCPKFVDTRWLSMIRVSSWLKGNRVRSKSSPLGLFELYVVPTR